MYSFCFFHFAGSESISFDIRLNNFATVLNSYALSFKVYGMYAANFTLASKHLEKLSTDSDYDDFQNFITDVSNDPICKGNDLGSYLIMPVQRLPRYILLLKELLKKLEILNRPSHLDSITMLQSAMKKLEDSANNVNESIRSRENGELLAKIQEEVGDAFCIFSPGRIFVRRDQLLLLAPEWKKTSRVRDGVVL